VDIGPELKPAARRFEIRLPLDAATLSLVRELTRTFLRQNALEEDLVEDLVLCIQEACKNAIRFSRSRHGVLVRVELDDSAVYAVVRDEGMGFERDAAAAPGPLAEHGRGLGIIRSLVDELSFRVDHGTELRMMKRRGAGPSTLDDAPSRLCA